MRITLAVCVVAIFLLCSAVNGQTQDRDVVLSVNGPRPLSDAAMQLESKLGTAISYEDVALIYAGDYARALDTDWGREYGERGDDRFKSNNPIVSRGGSLEIHVAIDPVSGTPVIPVSQTLQDVIDQHKARGNPGHFQLLTRTMRPDAVVTALQMTSSVSIPLRFSTGNEI